MGTAVPVIALIAGIAGTAYSAYAQKQAADYAEEVANRNAELAERAARDAAARGLNEGVARALKGGAARGAAKVGFAASGVVTTSGSALDVLSDAAMFNELDKQTTQHNAEVEARGLRAQAGSYLSEGAQAQRAGNYAAGATVLGGTASSVGNYYSATHK